MTKLDRLTAALHHTEATLAWLMEHNAVVAAPRVGTHTLRTHAAVEAAITHARRALDCREAHITR